MQSTQASGRGGRLSFSVREQLAGRIASGEMAPGSQLPSEPALAANLRVSRATLREALRSLEEEGLVSRTRGAGTFVTHRPHLRNGLDDNFGVTDAIRAAGMEPGTESVTVVEASGSPEEARQLGLQPGHPVVVVERVRTANRRPVVYSRDILPRAVVKDPAHLASLSDGSIYEYLERRLSVVVRYGVARLRPVKADRRIADKLRVIKGALLLYLRQLDFDETEHPVLYSHGYHLADALEFTVARRGPGRRFT
ncbi:MAG: GntR family transcriptional regulator [Actinomycetota bacterium]